MKRPRAAGDEGDPNGDGSCDEHAPAAEDAELHVDNIYRYKKPDFSTMSELTPFIKARGGFDWAQPAALVALTRALLKEDFGLALEVPVDGYL